MKNEMAIPKKFLAIIFEILKKVIGNSSSPMKATGSRDTIFLFQLFSKAFLDEKSNES